MTGGTHCVYTQVPDLGLTQSCVVAGLCAPWLYLEHLLTSPPYNKAQIVVPCDVGTDYSFICTS